jgi:hypothetical protein
MRLEINSRGNGACPLCAHLRDCRIQRLLSDSVLQAEADSEMEIVVYSCPYFAEGKEP